MAENEKGEPVHHTDKTDNENSEHAEHKADTHAEHKAAEHKPGFSFHKMLRRKHAHEKHHEESLWFDLKGAKNFMKRYGFLLVLLIPIFLSFYIRVQPWHLDVADSWAENGVYNMLRNNLRSQVSAIYPNLPDANKEQIVEEKFQEILKTGTINMGGQEIAINQIISDNANQLRAHFQDENGHTYLLGLDEYYWYRIAGEVVENGHQGNIEKDGIYYDGLILAGAPDNERALSGRSIPNLHVWVIARGYQALHAIDDKITLMQVAFFSPAIIAMFAVIPAFMIGRKIAGNMAGLIASIVIAVHPSYLARTVAGTPDTDVYVLVFPLLVAWVFLEACDRKHWYSSAILAAIAGLLVGLFSFTWSGWFFIIEILVLVLAGYLGFKAIVNLQAIRTDIKSFIKRSEIYVPMLSAAVFMLFSGIFVTIFLGFSQFISFIQATIWFTRIKEVATTTVWPNVLTTVAELNPSPLESTLPQISFNSGLLLWIAFCGIAIAMTMGRMNKRMYGMISLSAVYYLIIIMVRSSITDIFVFGILMTLPIAAAILYMISKKEDIDIRYSLMLLVWFVVGTYAGTKGVRFVMLLVPAFALAFGAACGWIYSILKMIMAEHLHINRYLSEAVAIGLVLILLIFPVNMVKGAYNIATNEVPLINDVWFEALNKIKAESQPDAIINSWWDFGHWFAAIGQRPVTLDGGRQNNPQAHWLGLLMLTDKEDMSLGILRMLDCGANTAFEKLYRYKGNDSIAAINLEYEMLPVYERAKAKQILLKNSLTDAQAEDVLQSTHCTPPEDFFITSEDMVGKSGVWAHFGSWNLTKASMYLDVHDELRDAGVSILQEKYGLNGTDADQYYKEISTQDANYWVAAWPSYAGGLAGCSITNNIIQCSDGLTFDKEKEEAYVQTQAGTKRLKQVAFIDRNREFKVLTYDTDLIEANNGRVLGAALIENPSNPNEYSSVLMDSDLVGSIFTRLFYFDGHGLSHFDMFYKNRDFTGADIIVWKIDWGGTDANAVYKMEEINVDYDADHFSKCLARKNATMYGTSWCSHCISQKRMLNNSAYIPFVDCESQADLCEESGVTGYPTWVYDGDYYEGEQTIEELSNITGCKIRKLE